MMLALVALLQAMMAAPATRPAEAEPFPWRADPASLSIVVARTVSESDPQPLCPQPSCTSLFLGRYAGAQTIAGPAVPPEFEARVEMGSPFATPYTLALLVERRPSGDYAVREMVGFNGQTDRACFDRKRIEDLGASFVGPAIELNKHELCVRAL